MTLIEQFRAGMMVTVNNKRVRIIPQWDGTYICAVGEINVTGNTVEQALNKLEQQLSGKLVFSVTPTYC